MILDPKKLSRWWELTKQQEIIKKEELDLRNELFGTAFPNPKEGSAKNKFQLDGGFILQGDYKINRNIDQSVISALKAMDNVAPLIEKVIDYAPKLVLKEWKALSDVDRVLLADLVTEKPGTPALKIVQPKR